MFTTEPNRRQFIKTGLTVAGSALALPHFSIGKPNPAKGKLRLAVIGLGNITIPHSISWAGIQHQLLHTTLLCDPDQSRLDPKNEKNHKDSFARNYPDAIRTVDYRTLFEQYGDEFDVVLCGSADHHHFGISQMALQHGRPIYCEKPVCWSPEEGHILRKTANENRVPTQMGNQGNSSNGWRVADAYYQHGHLGEIVEVHGWIFDKSRNSPPPLKTFERPGDQIPDHLLWKHWLGAADGFPYMENVFHPSQWRWWIPFGGGYIGDWGCHVFGGLFKTLSYLGFPSKVEIIKSTEFNEDQFPMGMTVKWTFPATKGKPQLDMYFHTARYKDPEFYPPRPEELDTSYPWPISDHGCIWKGTKGTYLFTEGHNFTGFIIPESKRRDIGKIEQLHSKIKGGPIKAHGEDWLAAVREEKEWNDTVSNFDYGAKLSSIVQMGNSALKAGKSLKINPKTGQPRRRSERKYFERSNPNSEWYNM